MSSPIKIKIKFECSSCGDIHKQVYEGDHFIRCLSISENDKMIGVWTHCPQDKIDEFIYFVKLDDLIEEYENGD